VGRARPHSEDGAFLVLWALLLVALMSMVAIVIDLGQARTTRRDNQAIADMAALAATTKMETSQRDVCDDAFEYIQANAPEFPNSASSPCAAPNSACTATTNQGTYTRAAGEYVVTIIYPLRSSDQLSDTRFPAETTSACGRVQVTVTRTDQSLFAGIFNRSELSHTTHAVARSSSRDILNIPSFWLLEENDCNVAYLDGGSKITVGTASTPGVAVFDTAARGCNPRSFARIGGSGWIRALGGGDLISYARSQGCAAPCIATSGGGIFSPVPTAAENRTGRLGVDTRYLSFINQLRTLAGGAGTPAGFTATTNCNPSGGTALAPVMFTGNVYVDCAVFNPRDFVTFDGNVVFRGAVSNSAGATLEFRRTLTTSSTPSTELASFIYVRSGNFTNPSIVRFNGMMLYLTPGTSPASGFIASTTGNGRVDWTPPTAGAFKTLSIWAETTATSTFQGGSASCGTTGQVTLNGIFFLPNSKLVMQGGGTFCSTAQYISDTLEMNGGTSVEVTAPSDGVVFDNTDPALIR
jgi:Flp pilus assembly protein TadG